jgi:hypothetical protein
MHVTSIGDGVEFVRGVDGVGAEHGDGHTPGPWVAVGPDDFGDFTITQAGQSPAIAAVVSNMRDPKVVAADAALVAAAPDLSAAKERERLLRSVLERMTGWDEAQIDREIDVERRALAEATE